MVDSKASAWYAHRFLESQVIMHNKHGQVFIGSYSQLAEEMERNPKDWNYSTFDIVMPAICMGLGVLLLSFIIFTGLYV